MASVKIMSLLGAVAAVSGCDDLKGFGGDAPALVTFQVAIDNRSPNAVALPTDVVDLRLALIWGDQFLTEPICILPPESDEVAGAIAAGCRDPFSFVPSRVAANVDVDDSAPGTPVSLSLFDLPGADVMIGGVTSRVAFGSFVLYDDRDGTGTLELERPQRLGGREDGPPDEEQMMGLDIVHGASFVTMLEPDQRVAFREGGFNIGAAFYPRFGCGDPLPSFSIVAAGGFTVQEVIAAQMRGELPAEDPAKCSEKAPTETVVTFPVRPSAQVKEVACEERRTDSSIRYREPPLAAPDLMNRTTACAKVVDFGTGMANGLTQLLISGRSDASCKGFTHYVLRGCNDDAFCELPEWDITATPPAWWPCAPQAAR